jgi:hypothetical protein
MHSNLRMTAGLVKVAAQKDVSNVTLRASKSPVLVKNTLAALHLVVILLILMIIDNQNYS